mmetsp:Transcript_47509/g.154228  ORF Transcript_47509/g.154228 Transcript_47509/m.154228 type:complete len:709 (-) Transcript_47509:2135-4261(-)
MMLCFLWYLFMPTTLACSSDMLVGPNCTPCADGFEPTVLHDGCVSCAADAAGTQGRCERCEEGFEPNAGQTACEKTLLSLMETIWLPLLGVIVPLLTAGFCTCGAEKQARGYTQQVNEDEDDVEVGTPKLRRRSPSMPLPPIVSRKLDRPGEPLSADESIECLVSCINYGAAQAERAKQQELIIVIGNTGGGKSTFVNMVEGCRLQRITKEEAGLVGAGGVGAEDEVIRVEPGSRPDELMKIGHTKKSMTFTPQVEAASSFGAGFAYADCPGFLDNRGFEINVANAANVRHTVCAASSAVVVVVVNYYSLRADRGKGLHDLLHILLSLFGSVEQVEAHAPSVLLAISQAPVTHPETGAAMSLERYMRTLLSPSGLDTATGEVLHALSGRVCVFHLLGRGDASWLARDALLERVRGLPPIGTPSSLFQSVLGSEDRERLRALIAALGKDLRECLSRCELRVRGQLGATSAAGFGEAARLAAELLELRVVEHGFVSSLVEGEVLAAARESVASQVAPVDALFLDGGLDGGDDAADGEREEARGAVRGAGELLAAFAGIAVVREPVQELVAQAEARLASAEERRAEARGRREMAAALQQTLRTVGAHALGEEYNVVREVLALPRAVAAAREGQARRQRALERAHAEQLGALGESGVAVRLREAEDRHAAERREEVRRSAAADAAWEAHIAAAAARLRLGERRRRRARRQAR